MFIHSLISSFPVPFPSKSVLIVLIYLAPTHVCSRLRLCLSPGTTPSSAWIWPTPASRPRTLNCPYCPCLPLTTPVCLTTNCIINPFPVTSWIWSGDWFLCPRFLTLSLSLSPPRSLSLFPCSLSLSVFSEAVDAVWRLKSSIYQPGMCRDGHLSQMRVWRLRSLSEEKVWRHLSQMRCADWHLSQTIRCADWNLSQMRSGDWPLSQRWRCGDWHLSDEKMSRLRFLSDENVTLELRNQMQTRRLQNRSRLIQKVSQARVRDTQYRYTNQKPKSKNKPIIRNQESELQRYK